MIRIFLVEYSTLSKGIMYRKLIDVRFISFETTLVPFLAIHFVEEFVEGR